MKKHISPASVRAFLDALNAHNYRIHALMIAFGDDVVYESAAAPYTLDTPHRLFSAAKSILSLSAVRAMQDGFLRPEDCVADYFPEFDITDPGLKQLTVDDLLTMRTGQADDPFSAVLTDMDADLIRAFFKTPTVEAPGRTFRYNNTVPHIVYAVTERATKVPFQTWQNRCFCHWMRAPLLAPMNKAGQYNPVVTCASARTFMKFAQLYLNEGTLNGRRYIDPEYVRRAVACHTDTGLEGNGAKYAWQIWLNRFGGYRMDGGWGQYAILLPEDNAAVVFMSDMTDCAYILDAFEEHLLLAVRAAASDDGEMPELASIAPSGNAIPDSSLFGCEWIGEQLRLRLNRDGSDILLTQNGVQRRIGLGTFRENRGYTPRPFSVDHSVYGADGDKVLLSGAWVTPHTFEFTGKCFAEMGETYCRLSFADGVCRTRYTPLAVHGIAARAADEAVKEVSLCRSPINC